MPLISAALIPVLYYSPINLEVLVALYFITEFSFKSRNSDQFTQIVDIALVGQVSIWKVESLRFFRDARFQTALNSISGQVISTIVQPLVKQSLGFLKSRVHQ